MGAEQAANIAARVEGLRRQEQAKADRKNALVLADLENQEKNFNLRKAWKPGDETDFQKRMDAARAPLGLGPRPIEDVVGNEFAKDTYDAGVKIKKGVWGTTTDPVTGEVRCPDWEDFAIGKYGEDWLGNKLSLFESQGILANAQKQTEQPAEVSGGPPTVKPHAVIPGTQTPMDNMTPQTTTGGQPGATTTQSAGQVGSDLGIRGGLSKIVSFQKRTRTKDDIAKDYKLHVEDIARLRALGAPTESAERQANTDLNEIGYWNKPYDPRDWVNIKQTATPTAQLTYDLGMAKIKAQSDLATTNNETRLKIAQITQNGATLRAWGNYISKVAPNAYSKVAALIPNADDPDTNVVIQGLLAEAESYNPGVVERFWKDAIGGEVVPEYVPKTGEPKPGQVIVEPHGKVPMPVGGAPTLGNRPSGFSNKTGAQKAAEAARNRTERRIANNQNARQGGSNRGGGGGSKKGGTLEERAGVDPRAVALKLSSVEKTSAATWGFTGIAMLHGPARVRAFINADSEHPEWFDKKSENPSAEGRARIAEINRTEEKLHGKPSQIGGVNYKAQVDSVAGESDKLAARIAQKRKAGVSDQAIYEALKGAGIL